MSRRYPQRPEHPLVFRGVCGRRLQHDDNWTGDVRAENFRQRLKFGRQGRAVALLLCPYGAGIRLYQLPLLVEQSHLFPGRGGGSAGAPDFRPPAAGFGGVHLSAAA